MASVVDAIKDKAAGALGPAPAGQHLALVLPSKGAPFELVHRPTPAPGPDDLLIKVKAIALNPIDYYQRDRGLPPINYPAVIGSDITGTVLSAGSAVPADAPKPGTRVTAFCPAFFTLGAPDYGAFQTHVLVPAGTVAPLPDSISDNEGTLVPMSFMTGFSALSSIGLSLDTVHKPADKQGMLVWGAASSTGSAMLQIARLMGFTVYGTASEKHHKYLKSLGASRLFDYRTEGVEEEIVKAAKEDGVTVQVGYVTAPGVDVLKSSQRIVKALRGDGPAKLASAVHLAPDALAEEGVETTFVAAPKEPQARAEFFHSVYAGWLAKKLAAGEIVPSPHVKVVGKGLWAVQKGLDELGAGVSGVKLVVEL